MTNQTEPIEVTVRGVKARITESRRRSRPGTFVVWNDNSWLLGESGRWRSEDNQETEAVFPSPAAAQAFVDRLNAEQAAPSPQAAAGETCRECNGLGWVGDNEAGAPECECPTCGGSGKQPQPASCRVDENSQRWENNPAVQTGSLSFDAQSNDAEQAPVEPSTEREHCPHCENQRGFVPCPYCHWNGSEPPQPPAEVETQEQPVAGKCGTWTVTLKDGTLTINDPERKRQHITAGHLSTGLHLAMALDELRWMHRQQPPAATDAGVERLTLDNLAGHAWLERFRKASYQNNFADISPQAANDIAGYVDAAIAGSRQVIVELTRQLSESRQEVERLTAELETAKTAHGTASQLVSYASSELHRLLGYEPSAASLSTLFTKLEERLTAAQAALKATEERAEKSEAA